MHKTMEEFIKEVEILVNEIQDELELTSKISMIMNPILENPFLLTKEQLLVKKDGFTLNRVHIATDESFSIGVGIWDVGQTTPIHDHGTWGVIGIYRGMEKEESFSYSDLKSSITFFDKSSISFLSSVPISILSLIIY